MAVYGMEYGDWIEQEAEEQRREKLDGLIERFVPPHQRDSFTKCYRLVVQVAKTWRPPVKDDPENRCLETCVQTGFMGGLAIAMGPDFPWQELHATQQFVVRQFIQSTDAFLKD